MSRTMSWTMILAGVVIAAFGLLFHLQGRGVVGPEVSFMYNSPDWFGYGIWILAAGAAVSGTGVLLRLRSR